MKIRLTSIIVDDQDKALGFYTRVMGFEKKRDLPVGEFKFLTVVSPDEPDGVELLLEPNDNPAAQAFQKALFEQGIAAAAFFVDDLQAEYERMQGLGAVFTLPPSPMGPVTVAILEDTCGNLIQIYQG
jgi:catechol 2,3-dioxygenase-like lactoylglutathione lyase family enzyme